MVDMAMKERTGWAGCAVPGSSSSRTQGSEFLQPFRSAEQNGLADDVWGEMLKPELDMDRPPQNVLSYFLQLFVYCCHHGIPFRPTALPVLGLSEEDKQRIRNWSSIMAQYFFADKTDEFIKGQVTTLLSSLKIDNGIGTRGPTDGRYGVKEYWNDLEPDADGQATEVYHISKGPGGRVNELAAEPLSYESIDDQLMNKFSTLHVKHWAEEFVQPVAEGEFSDSSSDVSADEHVAFEHGPVGLNPHLLNSYGIDSAEDDNDQWLQVDEGGSSDNSSGNLANASDEFINEQSTVKQQHSGRREYEFSDLSSYAGHPDPMKEGLELFNEGLLSEAVLALEAEVMNNPENAEGWRLLGMAHAENDDDEQAIAALMRAHEANPTNLEILLSLGVSHSNEMEKEAALKYLCSWLQHHPKYKTVVPLDQPDNFYNFDVTAYFIEVAEMSPDDTDVHIVLGVSYVLSWEYDKAIESIQTALKLKPRDYSLWNKLGAMKANSDQSADAILAYKQALDIKPNYVRAWINMGIGHANQGMYEDSIRYYVRALSMNPKADKAWQYLRISLSCSSRNDLLEACDSKNLDILKNEFLL